MFESNVVLEGNQTRYIKVNSYQRFESNVVLEGNQTFENGK